MSDPYDRGRGDRRRGAGRYANPYHSAAVGNRVRWVKGWLDEDDASVALQRPSDRQQLAQQLPALGE